MPGGPRIHPAPDLRNQFPAYLPLLQLQIGICVQSVVLEYVAGLDGLHQAQIVRVNDCGGKTLHHAHSNQSGIHDRADVLRHTVGVIGQTAGGVQTLSLIHI